MNSDVRSAYYLAIGGQRIRLPYGVIVGLLRASMLVAPQHRWTVQVERRGGTL